MNKLPEPTQISQPGEPTWEIAYLFPPQGMWSEGEYLQLNSSRLVEFINGYLEILPMPSAKHQIIVAYLYRLLFAFVAQHQLGLVLFAPFPVRLKKNKYREPDILFLHHTHQNQQKESHWETADLVMEVVSPDNPERDTVVKREEYAQAGIPEYWIVNPLNQTITVLVLQDENYLEHGVFGLGQTAGSLLLPGFTLDVTSVFSTHQ